MIAADILDTPEGPLTIQPVDHASMVLSLGELVIYVDPVGGGARYGELRPATAILLTHQHSDHFDLATLDSLIGDRAIPMLAAPVVADAMPQRLRGMTTVLRNDQRGELDGVPVEALPAHNTSPDRLQYHPAGVGNGYVLTLGGRRIYIAGDTEPTPAMLDLVDIDVAFLPMNLPYTMVASQAAEAVTVFRPRIVYPFHYIGGDEPEAFARLLEGVPDIEVRLRDWYALRRPGP